TEALIETSDNEVANAITCCGCSRDYVLRLLARFRPVQARRGGVRDRHDGAAPDDEHEEFEVCRHSFVLRQRHGCYTSADRERVCRRVVIARPSQPEEVLPREPSPVAPLCRYRHGGTFPG